LLIEDVLREVISKIGDHAIRLARCSF